MTLLRYINTRLCYSSQQPSIHPKQGVVEMRRETRRLGIMYNKNKKKRERDCCQGNRSETDSQSDRQTAGIKKNKKKNTTAHYSD